VRKLTKEIVIVAAQRIPMGGLQGSLASLCIGGEGTACIIERL